MTDIAKVITIIGSSPESFAKAADAAVQEAAKTVRGITGADVVTMSAVVENERISEYRTTVNIAFGVERKIATESLRSAEANSASIVCALPTASSRPRSGSASPRAASTR